MNPMTNMKNVKKLSEQELQRTFKTSWHDQYKDSAWIFIGGLPYDLTEGDIICIFSQYGEIVNINLVRDKDTGKQKGFCFICYEDQRSTVLAVDNFNGIKVLGRTIRVDHVSNYKMPKDHKNADAETRQLHNEGCGPDVKPEKKPQLPIPSTELPDFARADEPPPDGFRLPPRLPIGSIKEEPSSSSASSKKVKVKKEKKRKKDKKKKKSKKKYKKKNSSSESDDSDSISSSSEDDSSEDSDSEDDKRKKKVVEEIKVKEERHSDEDNRRNKNYKDAKYSGSDLKTKEDKKYSNNTDDDRCRRKDYEGNYNRRYERGVYIPKRYMNDEDRNRPYDRDRRDKDYSKRYKK